jgi:TolB-like protein
VPEEVEDVVLQALAKLPADRFATAGDMAEALRGLMATGTTGARNTAGRRRTTGRRKARQARPAWRRYAVIGGIAVPVLAAIAWTGVHFARGGASKASRVGTDTDPNRIAVLYFDDQSEGGKLRPLADGLTDALIDQLSAVKQLKVISHNGVVPFKGKNISTDSIQHALKVGTIVSGSVAQSGDRLRVKVRLVDAATGTEIDSKTVDRGRADLFQLQDELAQQVSLLLRKSLGATIESTSGHAGTSNASAWEAYQLAKQNLSGVDTILRTGNVPAALQRLASVDSQLTAVSAMDKKWTAPMTLRGFIAHRRVLLTSNSDPSQIRKGLETASGDAADALAVAPNDPDALELRGTARYFQWMYNLNPDPASQAKLLASAESDFRASVKANPLQATAWNALSHLLNTKSEFAEAKLAAQQAYDSDPYLKDIDKTIWRLFDNSVALNSRIEAEKWCTIGQQRMPDNYRFTECKLWLFALQGQKPSVDSIWSAYREYVAKSPANVKQFDTLKGGMLAALGLVRAGLPDSARGVISRSQGNPQIDPASELMYYEAQVRAQLGDKDAVVRLLTRYFAANPQQHAFAHLDQSWWWDSVRDYPGYKALVGGN